ncbi:MAG: right-handed parallel beta-helix repeat-containing protein [Gammaproteobacteria bacterium]|nr:right-handed parallel beta-helix repeat-containing protein [Gammaproteobacteria bacterium]
MNGYGEHTLTAKATDAAANTSTSSPSIKVFIDFTAPAAPVITSPSTGSTVNTDTPQIQGTAEAGSVIRLYNSDGSTLIGTATTNASGNWSLTTIAIALGAHNLTATATDSAGNTGNTSLVLDITVSTPVPDVAALFSAAPNWNDYVRAADPATACDGSEGGAYSSCLHGGEKRSVEITGYTSCAGLSASDALGVFDWFCDDSSNPVRMISSGLRSSTFMQGASSSEATNKLIDTTAHFITDGVRSGDIVINVSSFDLSTVVSVDSETELSLDSDIFVSGNSYNIARQFFLSEMIDFATLEWKPNAVTVKLAGNTLFTTTSSKWYSNPIVEDNDGGELAAEGAVYVVTTDPLANYNITANKIALVVQPDVSLTGAGNSSNTLLADSRNFLWLEGIINAPGNRVAVSLSFTKFSVLRNLEANGTNTLNQDTGIFIVDSSSNHLSFVTADNNSYQGILLRRSTDNVLSLAQLINSASGNGLKIETASSGNTVSNLFVFDNDNNGIRIENSSDNSLNNIYVANSGQNGLSIYKVDFSTFSNITVDKSLDFGVRIDSSTNNTLSDVLVSNSQIDHGISLVFGSNFNTLSRVQSIGNGTHGVHVNDSSGVRITDVQSFGNKRGVTITSGSGIILDNVMSANNSNAGVQLSQLSNSLVSNITSVNNNRGLRLNSADNNVISNATLANNVLTGLDLDYSHNNVIGNVAINNNGEQGALLVWSQNNTLSNFATAHNGLAGVELQTNAQGNYFTGELKFGNNDTVGVGYDCLVDAESSSGDLQDDTIADDATHEGLCVATGSSDFNSTTGIVLTSSFTAMVTTDTENYSPHVDGEIDFSGINDWLNFEHEYRTWGINQGPCVSGLTCQIRDWRLLQSDSVLRASLDLPSPAIGTAVHQWSNTSTTTFLRNAVEISNDGSGNDNGLCESDEVCLYTPNIASYQGHGEIVSHGLVSVGGVNNVSLMKYSTNGN